MTTDISTGIAPDASPTTAAISVRRLVKAYGDRRVLDGVSFEVRQGEIFGILGRNGTGKTSAVETIQGLRTRTGGQVTVAGWDPARDRDRLRTVVGAQLQSSALPDRIKVAEALRLFARLAAQAGPAADWRALIEQWGLAGAARRAFGNLSGGERQRLFIALALVNRPSVVFLDELTQGLDPGARRDTWRLVAEVRDQGATVVLVTHDMDEVEHLCDRILVLHEGSVRATGPPAEIVASLGGPVRTSFSTSSPSVVDGLEAVSGVDEVTYDGRVAVTTGDAGSVVRVAAELNRRGQAPTDFTVRRPSLEDAFLTLTRGPR